jgi:hypothetical protein
MPNDQTLPNNMMSFDSLAQAVFARFHDRPTLTSVARELFSQALKSEYPALDVDLSKVSLNTPNWITDKRGRRIDGYYRKPLLDVVTRSITGKTRWEAPGEHYLSIRANHNLYVDMQRIEEFLQVLPQAIIPGLQESLARYWSQSLSYGDTRGRWLGNVIKFALLTRVTENVASVPLDIDQSDTLMQIIHCPVQDDRSAAYGEQCARAYLVDYSLQAADTRVVSLSTQMVVTRRVNDREVVLSFGPSGVFRTFASLKDFADQEGFRLGNRLLIDAVDMQPYETKGNVFVTQAQAIFNNQLESLKSLEPLVGQDLQALETRYEQLTDLAPLIIDRSPEGYQQTRFLEVRDSLDDWLKRASGEDAVQYSTYVFNWAMHEVRSGGKGYNHDIPSAESFTRQVLQQALVAESARQGDSDQTASLDPDRIMVSQYRSTRTPFEVIDGVTPDQDYSIETLSLTQRALKNLLGLPFLLTSIKYQDGSPVPSWMTPDYLRRLIGEVDIGKVYPERVKRDLLDDPQQRAAREKLHGQQLRVQLPMLALKLKIRGESGFSQRGYRYVAALMHPDQARRYVDGREIVIGPLSFEPSLEQAHSDVEHAWWKPSGEVRNMFLIGPRPDIQYPNEPVVLYRPFYEEPLIEFPSRYAFMEELRNNTPRGNVTPADGTQKQQSLRESILDWLEPDARATYISNGFKEAAARYEIDFLYFLKGTALWRRKASHPLLSNTAFDGDPLPHLYEANARIVIRSADEKTVSGDEFRWERFNATRWAIASAIFPFVEGPWAVVGGMVVLAQGLKDIAEAEKNSDHLPAKTLLIQLLINLGAILLVHGVNAVGSRLIGRVDELHMIPSDILRAGPGARGERATVSRLANAAPGSQLLEKTATVVDFSTSMSGDAQAALEHLIKNTLGDSGPVPGTPLNGIRVVGGRWYARVPARLRGQGWAEVSPAGGENVFLLDGQGKPIPWLQLRHDGGGLWEIASEFRVRAGERKKQSLASLAKERKALVQARDGKLFECQFKLKSANSKIPEAQAILDSAVIRRSKLSEAIRQLNVEITNATEEQRPQLIKLLRNVQLPRMYTEYMAVEEAALKVVKLNREWVAVAREVVELNKQDPGLYSKDIVVNLSEIARVQYEGISQKLLGLHVENPDPGLSGNELFPPTYLELGPSEIPHEAFVKEQRRVLDTHVRLIEAYEQLESTLDELEAFSVSNGKRVRENFTKGQALSRNWRLSELELLKRALSGRSTPSDTAVQSMARDVLKQINVSGAADAQWEVLQHDGYGVFERIEVLDSALRQYDLAASMGRLLESVENPPVPQDLLKRFLNRLAELKTSAQEALSTQILDEDLPQAQALPQVLPAPQKKPAVKPAKKPSKRVFRNRNQETLVGDFSVPQAGEPQEVSMSDPLGGKPINYYKAEGQEDWQVRLEPPAPPVRPDLGLLNSLTAKGKRLLEGVDAFIEWVKKPTHSAPEPTSLQEMLETRAKELDKTSSEISQGLEALKAQERKPATVEVQARLRQQSARLIEEARLLRIKTSRDLPPSAGRFQYLLEQDEISVAKPVWTDKSTAREADFLLEYAILDQKKINAAGEKEVLWYAHFHCPAKSTQFIKKGHLKLKALRFKTYQDQLNEARNGEQVRAIKAGDISQRFADQYFFKTDE